MSRNKRKKRSIPEPRPQRGRFFNDAHQRQTQREAGEELPQRNTAGLKQKARKGARAERPRKLCAHDNGVDEHRRHSRGHGQAPEAHMGKAARTQRGSERGGGTEYDVQRAQHVCPGKHAHKVREETAQRDAHNGVRHKHGQQREGLAHTGLYGAEGDGGEHEAHSGVERRNERAADDGSGFCLFHGTVFLSGSILPHRCRRAGGVVRAKARRAQNPTEGTAF
mgnify:FL=1